MAKTMYEKIWESRVVHQEVGQPAIPLRRPAPHSRSDDTPSVRRTASKLDAASAAPTERSQSSTTTLHRPRTRIPAHQRPHCKAATRRARAQLRGVWHPPVRYGQPQPRHRAHNRPRARMDAAWQGDRLRRQPHVHTRGLRRACLWDRHLGSRTRPRNADRPPEQVSHDGDPASTARSRLALRQKTSS